MQINDALANEALRLADGANIHKIAGLVATYRSVVQEQREGEMPDAVVAEFERELQSFVAGKRIQRGQVEWPTKTHGRRYAR